MQSHCSEFARDGALVLRRFYDPENEIRPIAEGVRRIVELVAHKYGQRVPCGTAEEAMAIGYGALIKVNRAWGSEIYDAVKMIPAFSTLVANPKNAALFQQLRPGSVPGVATGGAGIRIDYPGEDKYRAPWHQEFPAQLRSADGLVFWSPLLAMSTAMGPVEIAAGSHAEGIVPVYEDTEGGLKSGAYSLRLDREQERLARYKKIAPLTEPGDLVVMDFLTLHQSGLNISDRPRWSMQYRYFNFLDPIGMRIAWQGSYAAGKKFADIIPELAVKATDA